MQHISDAVAYCERGLSRFPFSAKRGTPELVAGYFHFLLRFWRACHFY
jgi:hypothetical protein